MSFSKERRVARRRTPEGPRALRGLLLPLLVPIALLAASCADAPGESGPWPGVVDTLANGVIRVQNPDPAEWLPPAPWRLTEPIRIGSVDSGGPDQFADVRDVAVDGRGYIYVSHRLPPEVRVFDPGGRFVRRIGQAGEGPGEFQNPGKLEWGPRGHLWVADGGNNRFEVFDTAGAYVTSHRYAPGIYGFGDRWGRDGLLYTNVAAGGFPFRLLIVRRRLTASRLEPVDTVPAFGWELGESVPVTFDQDGRRFAAMLPVPFRPRSVAFLNAGEGWWVSDPGPAFRIARTDPIGDTVMVLERPYTPVPVSEEDVEGVLGGITSPTEALRDRIPPVHPPVEELFGMPDGSLLVRRRGSEGPIVHVFGPDGTFRGDLSWDGLERLTIHAATDSALYGVIRDDLDVPYVVRIGLER